MTKTAAASGPASQIDIGRSEGQRGYHNNKPLSKMVKLKIKKISVINKNAKLCIYLSEKSQIKGLLL